jgi:5-carboxymethyl-2-hydroxymuconate isomerase
LEQTLPHIVFETTSHFARTLPFDLLMLDIHRHIAELGHARLNDFKSRVVFSEQSMAGDQLDAEFIVIRLIMTNPRPHDTQREMALIIHDLVCRAIDALHTQVWWQCCVFIENFDRHNYIKTDSREHGR